MTFLMLYNFVVEKNHAHSFRTLCAFLNTRLIAHTLCISVKQAVGTPSYLQIRKLAVHNRLKNLLAMNDKISLMLVDDQQLFREGMAVLIDAIDDLIVVGQAGDGQEAIDLYADLQPDVVLMDVQMPGVNGIDATRRICAHDRQAKIIVLTTFENDEYIFEGLRAGARGYLLKATNTHKLANAVCAVHRGEVWMDSETTTKVVSEFVRLPSGDSSRDARELLSEPISERELEILRLMANGLRNRDIARQLHLAEGTVKNYISSLLRKLFVQDRTHAVVRAKELGLI